MWTRLDTVYKNPIEIYRSKPDKSGFFVETI